MHYRENCKEKSKEVKVYVNIELSHTIEMPIDPLTDLTIRDHSNRSRMMSMPTNLHDKESAGIRCDEWAWVMLMLIDLKMKLTRCNPTNPEERESRKVVIKVSHL